MIPLKYNTASQEVLIGPFLDDTDGKTAETGLTIANTDIKLWKSGGTSESSKNSGGGTHIASGRYYAVLDATDTNAYGPMEINVHVAGALPVKLKCLVMNAVAYDKLYSATGFNDVTAAANADAVLDELLSGHVTAGTVGKALTDMQGDLDIITESDGVRLSATQTDYQPTHLAVLAASFAAYTVATEANVSAVGTSLSETETTLSDLLTDMAGVTFDTATDSLEAIRDRGDAAWITGGGGGTAPTVEEIRTEIDSNSTALAAINAKTTNLPTDPADNSVVVAIGAALTALQAHGDTEWSPADISALTALIENLQKATVKKNTAYPNYKFPMRLTADKSAATGKTVTGQRSIDGGAFESVSGTIAEIGSGMYQFDALAADTNGDSIAWKFSATDCDDTVQPIKTST